MEAKNSNPTFGDMLYTSVNNARTIDISPGSIFVKISIGVVIIVLIVLFAWIGNQAALYVNACTNLDNIYGKTVGPNVTYFSAENSIKDEAKAEFDTTNSSKLINFHVKSAYNCCCGDGYKNNFVNLCALKKVITNGCRFLDFEIYSYNNDPIIASSTVENNYIKETYNALLLKDVLSTITKDAFDGTITNCARDPLILNFRVKSTNLTMLEKMGDLLEEYLDGGINSDFTLLKNTPPDQVIQTKMKDLYKTIIIICTFFPTYNITLDLKLTTLKNLINLDGNGDYCRTYRYNEIAVKNINDTPFIDETSSKYIIVLPNLLDNSITNFDSNNSMALGCQAIFMKHQNKDAKLEAYNLRFDEETNNKKYSWRWKLRLS